MKPEHLAWFIYISSYANGKKDVYDSMPKYAIIVCFV